MSRELKVGLLVLAALAVLAAGIFLVGERENLFVRKNHYTIRFETASGLSAGNPVQLNGVTVGSVERIVLPEDVATQHLTVGISIDQRYAARVRQDSLARIKTFGLLGDKYIEVSSGSSSSPQIPAGGEIPAAPATQVERLMASGEDVAENLVAISVSLRAILGRLERGEGLLGELTTSNETGQQAKEELLGALGSLRRVVDKIDRGEGPLGMLVNDRELGSQLAQAAKRLDAILTEVESGEGLLPALLRDAEMRGSFQESLADLRRATAALAAAGETLEKGDGLLPRLLSDEEYGAEVSEEIKALIRNLNELSEKLNQGDGTAARLINDPSVYEAIDDILVGIDESKMLRWLIRNRQKEGIRKRYDEERQGGEPVEPPAPGG